MANPERKLTTILSADVEGYSRLMGRDEEGTFETLKAFRDAMKRHIARHGGRVVNTWGDGLLAEFGSVVSAVRAAIEAQGEFAERNAGQPPEMQMLYRIGINLGDVIVDKGDIYGDGVNIAARLQDEAAPGGILISRTVYDQVRSKLSVGFEFLGNLDVKNIEEGVPAFSIRLGGMSGAQPWDESSGRALRHAPASAAPRGHPTTSEEEGASRLMRRLGRVEPRALGMLGLLPLGLVAVNLLTWGGTFWAAWPLLVYATLAGLVWAARTTLVDRTLAGFGVSALALAAINLLTWGGYFWAAWPILALALVAGVRLIARGEG